MAPKPNTASVAPTGQVSEIPTARTGIAVSQIAAEVGVAETTVRATCRQAKQLPRRKRRFTSDDLQRARQLYAQGRTYIEIGLELGFGRDTVKKHLAAVQVRGAHH